MIAGKEEFLGLELNTETRSIHIDMTKPQTIRVVGFDARMNPKEYFLKVTGRGIVLV